MFQSSRPMVGDKWIKSYFTTCSPSMRNLKASTSFTHCSRKCTEYKKKDFSHPYFDGRYFVKSTKVVIPKNGSSKAEKNLKMFFSIPIF